MIRNGESVIGGLHEVHRVCLKSRAPPAIFYVNHEAREEALRVHELRTLDSKIGEKFIYYNPKVGIVYLGDNTCINTLTRIRQFGPERVAIYSSGRFTQCCNLDDETYSIDGGVTPMQALHGFHRIEAARESRAIRVAEAKITDYPVREVWDDQWNFDSVAIRDDPYHNDHLFCGFGGLREVFFVVQSNICLPKAGEVGLQHTFRPAATNGLTNGQDRYKGYMQREIERVENDQALHGVGKNKWLGDNKPTFHWVSFSTEPAIEGRLYEDGLGVDERMYSLFRWGKEYAGNGKKCTKEEEWPTLDRVRQMARRKVWMPHKTFPGENPREVGFRGTKKAVALAKKMVVELVESIGEQVIKAY